jgi:maleylpyruvate isomerase
MLRRIKELGGDENAWAAQVIEEGFAAFDTLIAPYAGRFSFGDTVSLADLCLIPQLVNARRFGAKGMSQRILAIEAECLKLPAFDKARPENQPDAQ